MYTNLSVFILNSFAGDLSMEEVIDAFPVQDLEKAESFLTSYPEYIQGIPYEGDNGVFDNIVQQNQQAQTLCSIVANFD